MEWFFQDVLAGILQYLVFLFFWSYQAMKGVITGSEIKTFKQVYAKCNRRSKDPSNNFSDGLIRVVVAMGLILIVGFVLSLFFFSLICALLFFSIKYLNIFIKFSSELQPQKSGELTGEYTFKPLIKY